jgi:hypothetical protein
MPVFGMVFFFPEGVRGATAGAVVNLATNEEAES